MLEEGNTEYSYGRNTLIEMNMSLVRYAAGRFRSRGPEEMEDIVQVGMIGLIKAIDPFELSREAEFTSFAIPTSSVRSSGSSGTSPGPCMCPGGLRRPGCSWRGRRRGYAAAWDAPRRSGSFRIL
ncbi:Sigma-70 region 2 [Streptomyces sp. DconLS]|nr:Sigma-70 region 2 [Streptomyces sp. DconLS]SCF92821.1 Sigma-70 region 2 [Streptomyces sp. LamerLS-31b]